MKLSNYVANDTKGTIYYPFFRQIGQQGSRFSKRKTKQAKKTCNKTKMLLS